MKKYGRTDLAIEEISKSFHKEYEKNINDCIVNKIVLDEEEAKKVHKNPGLYYTIQTDSFIEAIHDEEEKVVTILSNIIKELLLHFKIKKNDKVFIVGLGNTKITPDSLGPSVIERIIVTNHMFELDDEIDNFGRVIALAPGVMAQTGMETSDIISSIVGRIKPKLVIVIDALASRSIHRVAKSIQVTSAGISPGSGVGNTRKELSSRTLNTNVVAIGIPTVVDIECIRNEIVDNIKVENKKDIVSQINNIEFPSFFLTLKEIDQKIEDIAEVISRAINISVHDLN